MMDLPPEPPAIIQLASVSQARCDQPNRDENYIYHYSYDYCYRLSYERPERTEIEEQVEELQEENRRLREINQQLEDENDDDEN